MLQQTNLGYKLVCGLDEFILEVKNLKEAKDEFRKYTGDASWKSISKWFIQEELARTGEAPLIKSKAGGQPIRLCAYKKG